MLEIDDQSKYHRLQKLFGVPIIRNYLIQPSGNTNNNNDNAMSMIIKRKHQRIVNYWSNYLTSSD